MKNVLIIEYDDDYMHLLKEVLEEEQYTVLSTNEVENAIDIISRGIKIDVILMSIIFDNQERYDYLKKISDMIDREKTILIGMSSSNRTDESKKAINSGCKKAISKPIEEEELIKLIENI